MLQVLVNRTDGAVVAAVLELFDDPIDGRWWSGATFGRAAGALDIRGSAALDTMVDELARRLELADAAPVPISPSTDHV